jgi:hypothetical protein
VLNSVGNQTVMATDTVVTSAMGRACTSVTAANGLIFSGVTATSLTAGGSLSFTLTATGLTGATLTNYTGTVHFTSTDLQAVLPPDYTFKSTDAGVHKFTVTLKTAGSQTISVADKNTPSITGSKAGIAVSPAALNSLRVAGFPATTAGASHTFTVAAADAFGNAVPSYAGTVHFSTTDWEGTVPANYTFTSADRGIHTFTAILRASSSQSIKAADVAVAALSGQQSAIPVNPAAFAKLVITSGPTSVMAGTANTFTLAAKDAYNNTIVGYTGKVHFSSTDSQANLPADYAYASTDHGIHNFIVTIKTAGAQRLSVVDTALASSNFNLGLSVTAAAASTLTVSTPTVTTSGTAQTFTVTARDAYGNVVKGYTGTVHFTSTDPLAVVPADYVFTAADAGTHTFTTTLRVSTASLVVSGTQLTSTTGTLIKLVSN